MKGEATSSHLTQHCEDGLLSNTKKTNNSSYFETDEPPFHYSHCVHCVMLCDMEGGLSIVITDSWINHALIVTVRWRKPYLV